MFNQWKVPGKVNAFGAISGLVLPHTFSSSPRLAGGGAEKYLKNLFFFPSSLLLLIPHFF